MNIELATIIAASITSAAVIVSAIINAKAVRAAANPKIKEDEEITHVKWLTKEIQYLVINGILSLLILCFSLLTFYKYPLLSLACLFLSCVSFSITLAAYFMIELVRPVSRGVAKGIVKALKQEQKHISSK